MIPSSPASPSSATVSASEIDASCRWPLLTLYGGAAFWLVVSAVATLVASMSFHAPAMFADSAWLSYGRMAPIARQTLLYGFCLPAGWAAALWMLSRLGQRLLPHGLLLFVAAKLWNLGVLLGVVGIAVGHSSGFELVEFPAYAGWVLLGASLLLGLCGLGALLGRRSVPMYPSQWFAGLGMLWFPWIYSTALLLLQVWPVRGITQAAVHGWYLAHAHVVLLGLLGLAAIFYFLPVLRKEALHSGALALFTLVGLILFGGWVGLSYTVPLPAWMGAIGKVMTVFLLLPVWAAVHNIRRTRGLAAATPESRYFSFSLLVLLAYAVLLAFMRVTPWGESLNFTVAQQSLFVLLVQGFSAVAGLGAAYFILPRIANRPLPAPALVRWHFWVASVAVVLIAGALLAGGFPQGTRLRDAQVAFTDVARSYLMSIRMASLGETLWILGALLFGYTVMRLTIELMVDHVRHLVKGPVPAPTLAEGQA